MRTITEMIYETDVEINDSFEDTIFSYCTFKSNVSIGNITSLRNFKFQNCQINGSFLTVSIHNNTSFIEVGLSFSNSQIDTLYH